MDLKIKLDRLRHQDNLALYRWTAGRARVASDFIPLTNLRFNLLTCDGGRVVLSIAAPVVLYEHGRQVIRFQDFGLGSVVEGERSGLTVPLAQLQRGEKAVELRYCCSRKIDGPDQPAWVEKRVMSMGLSPRTPVIDIVMPNLFRLTKHPEQLSWVHSRRLRVAMGLRGDSENQDVYRQLMLDNLESFGADTGSGWLVPAELASAGGMLVVKSNGINARTGGVVHVLPLTAVKAALQRRKWSVEVA